MDEPIATAIPPRPRIASELQRALPDRDVIAAPVQPLVPD
jgi:hypothetical protein